MRTQHRLKHGCGAAPCPGAINCLCGHLPTPACHLLFCTTSSNICHKDRQDRRPRPSLCDSETWGKAQPLIEKRASLSRQAARQGSAGQYHGAGSCGTQGVEPVAGAPRGLGAVAGAPRGTVFWSALETASCERACGETSTTMSWETASWVSLGGRASKTCVGPWRLMLTPVMRPGGW